MSVLDRLPSMRPNGEICDVSLRPGVPRGWFQHGFGIRTDGVTASMMASQERHRDAIKYLAGEGGDATDDRAINGCTALMLAALEGHP